MNNENESTKELIAYFQREGFSLPKACELALRRRATLADREQDRLMAERAAARAAALPAPSPTAIFSAIVDAGVRSGMTREEATSAAYTMADRNVTDPKPFPTHHGEIGAGADQRRGDREMIVETIAAISDRLRREHPDWTWEKVCVEAYRIESEQLSRAVGRTR